MKGILLDPRTLDPVADIVCRVWTRRRPRPDWGASFTLITEHQPLIEAGQLILCLEDGREGRAFVRSLTGLGPGARGGLEGYGPLE